jgi:hypothetical protein
MRRSAIARPAEGVGRRAKAFERSPVLGDMGTEIRFRRHGIV